MSNNSFRTNNKLILKNTLFLYIRMLLIMIVTLYVSRVVLRTLGVEDYGIYNIVGGIVVLFSFINNSLAASTQRLLNYELGKNNNKSISQVFSTSLIIHIAISVLAIILAETIGLWFLNNHLNIPSERIEVARLVYHLSVLTTCISFIQVPLYATIVAYEKMSFFAYVAIVEVSLKSVLIFFLQYVEYDKLELYSVLMLAVSVVVFLCYLVYCRTSINLEKSVIVYDKKYAKDIICFGGWMLLGGAASVGATQGVNIVLNIFYGVTLNAAMGICNQVNSAVNQFVQNFQTAFVPQITKSYAAEDYEGLRKLVCRSSRLSFFLLFTLAGPLMLNIDYILNLWLDEPPVYASSFCVLILIYSVIDSLSKPIGFAIHSTGDIKEYNILMSLVLSLNVILSYIFLRANFVPIIILVINIIVSIICFGLRLYVSSKQDVINSNEFIKSTVIRCLAIVCISIPLPIYMCTITDGLSRLLISSSLFLFIVFVCIVTIGLTNEELKTLRIYINNKFSTH